MILRSATLPFSFFLALAGCSLIASPDESLLGGGGTDQGGSGGTGGIGATGGGGMGATGGMGASGGTGGEGATGGMGGEGATGGTGGAGGTGGTGGGGGECGDPEDCPDGANECEIPTCAAGGVCGLDDAAPGTDLAMQMPGDCQVVQCTGSMGNTESVPDNADLPFDNLECTDDVCTAGVGTNPNRAAGQPCGAGLACDGMGACTGCTLPSQCPGEDNECQTRTCTAGQCGFNFQPAGTLTTNQTDGDCSDEVCDGSGGFDDDPEDTDLPNDNLECTTDSCLNGAIVHTPATVGSDCTQGGGNVCNAAGVCVGCVVTGDCDPATDCQSFACMNQACVPMNTAAGVVTGTQTPADCLRNECNGNGQSEPEVFDSDAPNDSLDCTIEGCSNGMITGGSQPSGFACDDNGGSFCNGSGACVQCVAPTTCPGMDTDCQSRTCNGNMCGVSNAASGFACDDNGGAVCNGSGTCVACVSNAQCGGGVCVGNVCMAASCNDGTLNGLETDIDCGGGACPDCGTGDVCLVGADCVSNNCVGFFCAATVVAGVTATGPNNAQQPADGLTGVPNTPPTLVVTFSGAMTPASLTTDTTLDAGACTGSIQVSTDDFTTCIPFAAANPVMTVGDTVATLTPSPHYTFGSTYKVRVTAAALDAAGTPVTPFQTTTGFTTRTDAQQGVVISQVYGAGGNAGATFQNDFIELHNRSSISVDISGWSVQYASSTGTSWQVTVIPASTTIPAGGYYLIQEAGGANGAALPTADSVASPPISMSATAGKVALVVNSAALTGSCPSANVVDFVGFGVGTNCFEGTVGPSGAPSITNSALRRIQGCLDTNNTPTDIQITAVNPRNSASALNVCPGPARNETNTALEADYCVLLAPLSLSVQTGMNTPAIEARIYEAGTTEAAGASGSVLAQIGYGSRTSNAPGQVGWTWVNAPFDFQDGNDDEYQVALLAPAPGDYAYAARFSLDGGATWTFCDGNGAGSNSTPNPGFSYESPRVGYLTVTP